MIEVEKIISRIETLLDNEEYSEAMTLAGEVEQESGRSGPLTASHRKISLLLARAKYHSNDYEGAEKILARLKLHFPGIEDEKDFIFLESQLMVMQGDASGAARLLDNALDTPRPKMDEFFIRFCLAKACFWKGDYLTANLLLEACRHFYISRGDDFMLGNVNYMLGYTAFQRSFFDQADSWYGNAIECYEKAGKRRQIAATLHMTGILRYRTGKYDEAEQFLRKAGRSFEKNGDQSGITENMIAQARVHMFRGECAQAESLLGQAYYRARTSGYSRGMALSAEFLGEIDMDLGRTGPALKHLDEAGRLGDEISREGDIAAEVCRRLGELHVTLGNRDKAAENLSRALEISVRLHDDYELGCVLRGYGRLEAQRGCRELSLSYFNEAISLHRIINERFELAATCMTAARTFIDWAASGDDGDIDRNRTLRDARIYATEAAHLYQSLGLTDRIEECEKLAGKLLNENYHVEDLAGCRQLELSEEWICEESIVARSPQMRFVVSKTLELADSMMPVLITGETGTGKEVIARLLHRKSARSGGPFIAINCASIPDTVFESEMFGHRKGAFTGADRNREGIIERASGGTLFLDEISELSVAQQAKLLRVFQEQKVRRVGESEERHVDIRLISASNQNMDSLLRAGKLRKDFYYRVLTASIEIEPLRRRKDDIEALFAFYMAEADCDPLVEKGVIELLRGYHWPGNVRQLISVVRILAMIGKTRGIIGREDLPLNIRARHLTADDPHRRPNLLKTRAIPSIGLVRDPDEMRQLIVSSLVKMNGNKSAAARELGISRSTLYRNLKEMGIE